MSEPHNIGENHSQMKCILPSQTFIVSIVLNVCLFLLVFFTIVSKKIFFFYL